MSVENRLAAATIVLGATAYFVGDSIGGAIGAWSAGSREAFDAVVADNLTAWRLAVASWIVGIPLAAAGVGLVARRLDRSPGRTAGIVLWAVAAWLGVIASVLQGQNGIWEASPGAEAEAFPFAVQRLASGGFMVLAYAGTMALGVAALRALDLPRAFGWAAVAVPVLLVPAILLEITAGALLAALPMAAMGFAPVRPAAQSRVPRSPPDEAGL